MNEKDLNTKASLILYLKNQYKLYFPQSELLKKPDALALDSQYSICTGQSFL